MDLIVFLAVLAGAVMHAGWNALVKTGLDRTTSIFLLAAFQGIISLALIPLFVLPAALSWPWIAVSALLHSGYKIFLIRAYEHGDFSQVYPLARGSAPLIVAIAGIFLLNESLTAMKFAAVCAIGLGVMLMSAKFGAGEAMPRKALLFALGTALFTASYTLVDAVGAQLSGTASGFTLWMFAGDGILMTLYALLVRGRGLAAAVRGNVGSGIVAGVLSLGSYWIAIWAFTLAPVALVAALRETSVLFAMLIAVFLLGEKAGAQRWLAAALILAGIVLIRL
ncbi:MAG: EamA family transporter [Xanthobacteraceae bacterium]|nr:EamA family transporter [Xanthobacteraceae bacterium]QYK44522.1 MAG: EamA family transporter [Xanthobacteraceae bacterium]